ncbi:MAG: alpha/beta hydrolase [Polynucleobacter sp.]|nr:alpha/beta hydrolase [Polynucleobacter sp.]
MPTPAICPPMNSELLAQLDRLKVQGLAAPDVTTLEISLARHQLAKQYQVLNEEVDSVYQVRDITFQFEGEDVITRLYYPTKEDLQTNTMIIYLHGGGWSFGDYQTHDGISRSFAHLSNIPVATVSYALAPEKKFPYQHRQITYVIEQLIQILQQQNSGAPPQLIFLGDSAGANLALSIWQNYLSTQLQAYFAGMVLFYGVYTPGMQTHSWQTIGDGRYGLSSTAMQWYWSAFLETSEQINQASPILANLNNLPPIWLMVGDLDPLIDDTTQLAHQLQVAKVKHACHILSGYPHGFLRFCNQLPAIRDVIMQAGKNAQQMLKGTFI